MTAVTALRGSTTADGLSLTRQRSLFHWEAGWICYFCVGNALAVPLITRMGGVLDAILSEEMSTKQETHYQYENRAAA